jgi:anti-sigma factor RsiW
MKCEEAEVLLHALLDDELDAGHARAIETHVASCKRCAAQLRDYRAMRGAFAAVDLHFTAPADLRRRIDARLPAPVSTRMNRRSLLKGFAGGVGLSSAIAAGLVLTIMRTDQNGRVMSDLVSAHLRSLQAEHLTDVLSTDQHTVKPWFDGRLDFSPPVRDLADQGFPLVGGRLDYIGHRAVAALVYQRRKHYINVFVWPTNSADASPAAGSPHQELRNGYNVIEWRERDMDLFAVSDVSADDLKQFMRLLDQP